MTPTTYDTAGPAIRAAEHMAQQNKKPAYLIDVGGMIEVVMSPGNHKVLEKVAP